MLRLQQPFKYTVEYVPGPKNIADPLSRLSEADQEGMTKKDDSDDHAFVQAVCESVAVDVSEIKQAIDTDDDLKLVKEALETYDWSSARIEIKENSPFKDELSLFEGYILRGNRLVLRLVIPKSLRTRMMNLAHEGHPGEVVMVNRLRGRVWWLGIDKEARLVVKHCRDCQLVSKLPTSKPMVRRRMPNQPWVDLAMDFKGPLPSGEHILVLIDY